jgi:hypothetical protein
VLLVSIACALLIGAVITGLLQLFTAAFILGALGMITLVCAFIRRFGRPGDFSRSGWSGM